MDDQGPAFPALNLPPRPERYVPIADYALIGDTRAAALVARDGAIDWLCLPGMPDPSVFAELLDRERGGCLYAGPPQAATVTRRYLPRSAVLETTFRTPQGVMRMTDFMPVPFDGRRQRVHAGQRLIRMIEAIDGEPELAVRYAPRPGYAERMPRLRKRGAGVWTVTDGRDFLMLQSDLPLSEVAQGTLHGSSRLQPGQRITLALSFSCHDIGVIHALSEAADELRATLDWWDDFCATCTYHGPFRDQVLRSLMTLRMLTFSQSGAILAAPTTSLPEAIGGKRNWDYRYCWLRDASFLLDSFLEAGYRDQGDAFFRWLSHATQLTAPRLNVLYNVFGHTMVPERTRHALEGWRGSAPVRTGNGAQGQLQLDVYGEVACAALSHARSGARLEIVERKRLVKLADMVCKSWTLPDNGIWEMRGGRRHYTYSKAMCWAALNAVVALCREGHLQADAPRYLRERDAIRASILSRGVSRTHGTLTAAYGHDYMDASLLMLPRLGLLAPDDPLMVATFARIERDLGHGAQLRRYPDGIDGFASTEGTFTACGFWAADYLARRGDVEPARTRIAALLDNANDLGLMSEETDPQTGAMLGNFPQAFSHAGLIRAAIMLDKALADRGMQEQGTA